MEEIKLNIITHKSKPKIKSIVKSTPEVRKRAKNRDEIIIKLNKLSWRYSIF